MVETSPISIANASPELISRIIGTFGDAQVTLGVDGQVTLPHTLQAFKFLRANGVKLPPPILTQYSFPVSDPTKPAYDKQKLTCGLMSTMRRAYNLNDIGTGKTRTVLWTYDFLRSQGLCTRMLVIAPLSTLIRTWLREIRREFPWLRAVILHGKKSDRLKELALAYDIYIINHHGLATILPELQQRSDIDTIAIDELSTYRNGRSKTLTLPLKEYVKDKKWVWGITGSPIPRAVTDVWGQASIVTPNTIPPYFSHLRNVLMWSPSPMRWEPRPNAEAMAVKYLSPSVRYKLSDIQEMPERFPLYYEAELSAEQERVYKEMSNTAVALIQNKTIDALNAGAVLSKLLQVALGYVYTRDGNVIELDNTPRLQLIVDLIDSCAEKVLLFAPFKSAINGLHRTLESNKITHCIVHGDVSPKERAVLFEDFQETGKYKVCLAHPVCMSHGLTLTAATMTIWAGPITSLDTFYQANGRNFRLGQTLKTLIAMVGGTAREKKIYQLLGRNEKVQNKFLELIAMQTEARE